MNLKSGVVLNCPRCEVAMRYNAKYGFWKCPECGGEFWEDEEETDASRAEKERYEYLLRWGISKPAAPVLPPIAVPVIKGKGKGNRKAGRRTSARKRYKLLRTERYML